MRTLIVGLILVSLVISGCTIFGQQQGQNMTNNTTVAPPPPPPKPPTFSITSPSDGQVFTIASTDNGSDVELTLSSQNLVVKTPGGAAKKGEGHFQLVVDSGQPIPLDSKAYTIPMLPPGNHTIQVTLYNNDNTPYSPALSKQVTVDIEQQAPLAYIPQSYNVSITGSAYSPDTLSVKVGDSVTWINNGNVPQSATCFVGGKQVFDSKTLGPGQSATITFSDLLECDYYSILFRAMKGHISVVSNGTGS